MNKPSKCILEQKRIHRERQFVILARAIIVVILLVLWEIGTGFGWINPFFFSSPSQLFLTFRLLIIKYNLMSHIAMTFFEVAASFLLSFCVGFLSAAVLWRFPLLYRVIEPFLLMFNAIPKVALAPLIVFLFGSSMTSILLIGTLMLVIVIQINLVQLFIAVKDDRLIWMHSLRATKLQIFRRLVVPACVSGIVGNVKTGIGLAFIGVILGEFQVGKMGLGYLITYGTQMCKLNIVIATILILMIIAMAMQGMLNYLQRKFAKPYR